MPENEKCYLDDSRLQVRELVFQSAVHRILTKNLDMRKLCAKWVQHLFTIEQKQCHDDVSIHCSAMFYSNKAEFLH